MSEFACLLNLVKPWVHEYGVAAVFVILTLESLGVPLPGESLLVFSAVLAARGDISLVALFVSAWSGAVLGDNIGYLIGRKFGRSLLLRYGGKIGLNAERLAKVEAVFARYGPATVGFARFFDVLRQLNGIVAGALEMRWQRFLFFNAIGAAIWVLTWTMAGYYVGQRGTEIALLLHKLGYLGMFLAALALTVILISFYRRQARSRPVQRHTEC
jgi:membrane protein DedA with SNARE-associated domain